LAVGYVRSELAYLVDVDADLAAAALSVVLADASARTDEAQGLLMVIGAALAPAEMTGLRDRLVAVAGASGLVEVEILLGRHGAARAAGNDELERVPDFGAGRPLALGERKSLARRRDRQLLARVLRDPHPDVIRILLGNPALTEDDVIRLAARRPVRGEVLREIASSVRWIIRYGVRLAVLKNPYAPLEVVLPLVPLMTTSDLALIAESADLAPELREIAARGPRVLH
jgi:hypothetical protein